MEDHTSKKRRRDSPEREDQQEVSDNRTTALATTRSSCSLTLFAHHANFTFQHPHPTLGSDLHAQYNDYHVNSLPIPDPTQFEEPAVENPPTDFPDFANHLPSAETKAYLARPLSPNGHRPASRPPTSSFARISVLLIKWDGDSKVEGPLLQVEKAFRNRNCRTARYSIPITLHANIKLSRKLGEILEQAAPGHPLVVYYAGFSFLTAEGRTYWAW